MKALGAVVLMFVGVFTLIALLSMLYALPTMLLWNWVMPAIFGLTKITFWQAFGLTWLCGLLFKASHSQGSKS